jgi:CHAT domain-containing protein
MSSWLIPFYEAYVAAAVDQDDNARALRVVESSRARVLSERLDRSVEAQQFPSRESFQHAAAATHSAILCFWIAHERSFAWLISAGGVERFNLPPVAEISALVTKYRETVEHSLRDPLAANDPAGTALWHALMENIAPKIPQGASLIVIPDGQLHRLNLETLMVPGPRPHYWIEDVSIAVAPSITIAASAPRADAAPTHAALLIGDPAYKGTSYEPLPKAAEEIRDIRQQLAGWTQKVYESTQASPPAYRQSNPAQFSLIHFAAHAEANYERPLESAVILSSSGGQYKLFARDVTEVPIQADLVTISACRGAGARTYAGEGLLGFAWAFLNAGARAVIAGLWDVSDSSTGALMDRLYTGIAAGKQPAAALRDAKLALLNGTANFRKPFYWAPFQIYLGSAAHAEPDKLKHVPPTSSETRAGTAPRGALVRP